MSASSSLIRLNGNVPVVFQTGNQMHPAGAYEVAHGSPGIVSIKAVDGAAIGIPMMAAQTEDERTVKNSLTFARNAKGNFQLAGYCISSVGCWANSPSKSTTDNQIEVAMVTGK